MEKEDLSNPDSVSSEKRRDLLLLAGVAGSTLLAGCGQSTDTPSGELNEGDGDSGGDGSSDGDGGSGSSGGDETDQTSRLDITYSNSPFDANQLHQNLFNPTGSDRNALLTARYFTYDELWDEYGSWRPCLLEEQEFNGDSAVWHFREGIEFMNGEEVNAETYDIEATLAEAQGDPVYELVSSREVVDKYTYRFEFAVDLNLVFWGNPVIRGLPGAFTPEEYYGEYYERLEDATTDSERESVIEDLTSYRLEPNSDGYFPNTSSPFRLSTVTSQYQDFTVRDDHPDAELFNYDTVRMWTQDFSKQLEEFTNGNIDVLQKSCCGWWNQSDQADWPDEIETFSWKRPKYNVIAFNLQHDWFGNRKVRQAVAYMTDREEMATATWGAENSDWYPERLHGLNSVTWEEGWKDELSDINYIDYGVNSEPEKATAALEEAGWSKQGGQWVDGNGEQVSWSLIIQGGSAQQSFGEVGAAQMNEFGIETQSTRVDDVGSSAGDMNGGPNHMTTNAGGGRGNGAVISAVSDSFSAREGLDPNITDTIMVPMPIGNPDGDLQEVDPDEVIRQLGSSNRADRVEATRMLTWMHNTYMPMLPTTSGATAMYTWTNNWSVPTEEAFSNGKFPRGGGVEGKPWQDGLYFGHIEAANR